MVYFRELPAPLKKIDDDFLEIFFNFANTYTEESVLRASIKEREEKESAMTKEQMLELGYSEEDILNMNL